MNPLMILSIRFSPMVSSIYWQAISFLCSFSRELKCRAKAHHRKSLALYKTWRSPEGPPLWLRQCHCCASRLRLQYTSLAERLVNSPRDPPAEHIPTYRPPANHPLNRRKKIPSTEIAPSPAILPIPIIPKITVQTTVRALQCQPLACHPAHPQNPKNHSSDNPRPLITAHQ